MNYPIFSLQNETEHIEYLSYLLYASTGIQNSRKKSEFRTVPSAGALYPIETYLIVNNVEDLECGVYHYSIQDHSLELIMDGEYGNTLAQAALNQFMCEQAAVNFINIQ